MIDTLATWPFLHGIEKKAEASCYCGNKLTGLKRTALETGMLTPGLKSNWRNKRSYYERPKHHQNKGQISFALKEVVQPTITNSFWSSFLLPSGKLTQQWNYVSSPECTTTKKRLISSFFGWHEFLTLKIVQNENWTWWCAKDVHINFQSVFRHLWVLWGIHPSKKQTYPVSHLWKRKHQHKKSPFEAFKIAKFERLCWSTPGLSKFHCKIFQLCHQKRMFLSCQNGVVLQS